MEEQKDRISFRIDKKSEALSNVKKNKFGHTTTGKDFELDDLSVQLRAGGTSGVEAHVDIFSSPTMKQFMQQNNLDLNETIETDPELIDLADVTELEEQFTFARPDTLEEFDIIADEVLGVKQNNNQAKKIFAQPQAEEKHCPLCKCKNKSNSKFCSNCGKPFLMASFCKNCGNKFENQEKFCSECGTRRE